MTNQHDVFHDDRAKSRFELAVGDQVAYADYRRDDDRLVIDYVYAPPALRGTGASGRLMRQVAQSALAEGRSILARCGFARAWFRGQPAYRDLLSS